MYDEGGEPSWQRTVGVGLAALAAAAVIIGVAVGVMAVGAARITGLGESASGPSEPQSLYMPPYTPTPKVEEPLISEGAAPQPGPTTELLDPSKKTPSGKVGEITLFANPTRVSDGERISLNGLYLDGEGVSLQVQRREGDAWVDFPTTATVRSGAFDTYVYTGRTGENRFRVFDPTTGRSSNSVSVTVR
jgi:hypothetical protein